MTKIEAMTSTMEFIPVNVTPNKKIESSDTNSSWHFVAHVKDFPTEGGACAKIGDRQIAIYNFTSQGKWYACQNKCPHKGDNILSRGMIGDVKGEPKVACPFHKKSFSLTSGACLSGEDYVIETYPVKVEDGKVYVKIADS